jgi:type I restriction enzyme, S subunit
MIDWPEKTLGEICSKITDGSHSSPKSVENGKPMASVKDLNTYGLNLNSARHISEDDFQKLVKQGCKPLLGDVLIAKDGNTALDTVCVQRENEDVVLLSSVAILRPNTDDIIPEFLKFYFSNKPTISYLKTNFISGAAIPRVILKDFKKAIISLPSITEQKSIATVLGTLDDKIENNRKMNETLEEMAHAIFKSWFLDFDPVHAKVTGNAPAHMDADTAALFPSSFGDEGLPMGWSLKAIEEIGDVITGKTPSTKHTEYFGNEYPFIKIPNMNSVWVSETEILLSKAGHQTQAKKLLPKGAVLVSCIASVGAVSIAKKPSHTNQQVNAVIPTKGCPTSWMYCALVSLRTEIIGMASGGSVTPNLNKGDFSRIKVICSSNLLIVSFDKIVGPLFDKILSNDEENQTLTELRDTLLPKLMSGEIRVTDAEREVEAAV